MLQRNVRLLPRSAVQLLPPSVVHSVTRSAQPMRFGRSLVAVVVAVLLLVSAIDCAASASWLAPSWQATIDVRGRFEHQAELPNESPPISLGSPAIYHGVGEVFYDAANNRSSVAMVLKNSDVTVAVAVQQSRGMRLSWFAGVCAVPPMPLDVRHSLALFHICRLRHFISNEPCRE